MTTAKELRYQANVLDEIRQRYPKPESLMAGLIVDSLHDKAFRIDPSLYAPSTDDLTNEDKFNCAGFAGADTHSGGD